MPTQHGLPRPDLLAPCPLVCTLSVGPWLVYGFYWGGRPLGPPNPRVTLCFSFVLPNPYPCSKTKLVPENSFLSLLSCNPPASTFSPSSLFSDEVQEKFPPVHLLRDVQTGALSWGVTPLPRRLPQSVPRGTGAAGLTKASGDGRFCRRFFNVLPTPGTELYTLASQSLPTSHCTSDNRRARRLGGRQCLEKLQSPSLLQVLLQRGRMMELIQQLHWAAPKLLR